MSCKNYFTLKRFSLMHSGFAYVDVADYYADNLFIKHEVTVDFGQEWTHPDHKYRIIFCRCKRWKRRRFIAAMHELPYIMALNGHGDYEEFCNRFMKDLEKAEHSR